KRALDAGDPVTRSNFLKGQAVNGAFGVMARLARHLELIADDGRPGAKASTLMSAWADDEGLPGVLDADGVSGKPGATWSADVVKATAASTGGRSWPGPGSRIWDQLGRYLRADRPGRSECRTILGLLRASSIRRRVIELLE